MANIAGLVAVAYDINGNRRELAYSDSDPNFAANYKNQAGTAKVLLPPVSYNACASDLDIAIAAQPLMAQINPAIALAMSARIAAAQAASASLG